MSTESETPLLEIFNPLIPRKIETRKGLNITPDLPGSVTCYIGMLLNTTAFAK